MPTVKPRFSGKTFDPFVLNGRSVGSEFQGPRLLPPDYLSALRVDRRATARDDRRTVSKFETSQDARLHRRDVPPAYTLMSSQKAREAFELAKEPEDTRRRYGQKPLRPELLLARASSKPACAL